MDAKQRRKKRRANHAKDNLRVLQQRGSTNPTTKGRNGNTGDLQRLQHNNGDGKAETPQEKEAILICPFCQSPTESALYQAHMLPVIKDEINGHLWSLTCEFCGREVTDIDWQTVSEKYQVTIHGGLTYIYADGEQLCFKNNEKTIDIIRAFRRWMILQEVF